MGLAKRARFLACLGLVAAALFAGTNGCNNSKSRISSQSILAPQLVAPVGGQSAVQVSVSKVDLLREAFRKPGVPDKLDSELRSTPAHLTVVERVDANRLLVFETVSKTFLTLALDGSEGAAHRVLSQEEITALFNGLASKPTLGPAVRLESGWILVFEKTANGILAVRPDPAGGPDVIAKLLLSQSELQHGFFFDKDDQGNEIQSGTKTTVSIQRMVRFDPPSADGKEHVLLVPGNTNLARLDYIAITATGHDHPVEFPGQKPFLEFATVSQQTKNKLVDLKDFP